MKVASANEIIGIHLVPVRVSHGCMRALCANEGEYTERTSVLVCARVNTCVCMRACVHACVSERVRTQNIHMYMYMHACVCACVHACVSVC